MSTTGAKIRDQFEEICRFAHFGYEDKKINFRKDKATVNVSKKDKSETQRKKAKQQHEKILAIKRRAKKVIEYSADTSCPKCGYAPLKPTSRKSKRYIVDLVPTKSGIKKTTVQHAGVKGYCKQCGRDSAPLPIRQIPRHTVYGHGFSAWVVYHRVALRLPYESIIESLQEHFHETISISQPIKFLKDHANYYSTTEQNLVKIMLNSPSIHVDETKANIRGANWYVWVFANAEQVIFRLTETREATIVHELLGSYKGILVSDFYPGYDSVNCQQQKCWVHFIRDLNDDLRANPFDTEYEHFVAQVRNLIVPIMETIQKYGLKKRHLNKFHNSVNKFYNTVIITSKPYKSEIVLKHQKRFVRYRGSLFTFLEEDGILWHNNTAERAIRPFARLRDSTRSPLHASATHNYLVMLGICQTCRFQGKSFFKFLFSGETDLDEFQKSKRSRKTPK